MPPRIAVVALWAEDVSLTAHFYRDVISLPMLPQHGSRPHFDLGGSFLVILQGEPEPARHAIPERFPVLALAVDDLDLRLERLRLHLIDLPWGVESDSRARWAMFYDPAGNLIELVQFDDSSPT
jgi:catechol-2,3-dioxygenase